VSNGAVLVTCVTISRMARGFVPCVLWSLLDVVLSVKICELIITTSNPSTTTVLPALNIHKGVSILSVQGFYHVARPSYIPQFPSSPPLVVPSPFPFVLRSSALSASSHPWGHLTRSSPHALSSVSYSVPFRFIGIWKVKHRPDARFF
jgi:hypothetical protein